MFVSVSVEYSGAPPLAHFAHLHLKADESSCHLQMLILQLKRNDTPSDFSFLRRRMWSAEISLRNS